MCCRTIIPRQLLVCKLEGVKRTARGQTLRWVDVVSKDLKSCQVDKDWREIAQDRNGWTAVATQDFTALRTVAVAVLEYG